MAFYFLIICLFLTRCFIYLNAQNSKSGNCTKEEPCKYLSRDFNLSFPNSNEIHIIENSISSNQIQEFVNLIYFCAEHEIKLYGLNQSINLFNSTFEFNHSHSLFLINFTFTEMNSLMIKSNDAKICLNNITFAHFKTQIMNFKKSDVKLKSCLFINNAVRDFNLLEVFDSNVNFTNCSFNSISQFPQINGPVIYFNYSQSFFQSCNFINNYINNVFFESNKSKITFVECKLHKNGGKFFIKCTNQSITLFDKCEFFENSCLLFHITNSKFLLDNVSISHNCVPESFCVLNNSHSKFSKSNFISNSCGPILNSSNSEIEITQCFFSNNVSPSNMISIDSGKISIICTNFVNSTTSYGSSIFAFMTILYISNSTFNSSHSRICGASILVRNSELESISNLFINSKSLTKGLSICFDDCHQKTFKIDKNSFLNSQNEKDFSIYTEHCSGTIHNSLFNRTIDDEIPLSLHDKCFNCTFMKKVEEKKINQITDYISYINSFDDNYNEKIKISIVLFLILIIICALYFRRKLRIFLRRFARKHDN